MNYLMDKWGLPVSIYKLENVVRWMHQTSTAYKDLSEKEKQSDRDVVELWLIEKDGGKLFQCSECDALIEKLPCPTCGYDGDEYNEENNDE